MSGNKGMWLWQFLLRRSKRSGETGKAAERQHVRVIAKDSGKLTERATIRVASQEHSRYPRHFIAPVETGEPWRSAAQADWEGSRDG